MPKITVNVGHHKVGQGFDINSTKGAFTIETDVSDDISIGAYLKKSESPLHAIFGRFSQK